MLNINIKGRVILPLQKPRQNEKAKLMNKKLEEKISREFILSFCMLLEKEDLGRYGKLN